MIEWTYQGAALVGVLTLANGEAAQAVIVGPRDNPKGATIVVTGSNSGKPTAIPLGEATERLRTEEMVDIVAMQERVHGTSTLQPPAPPFGGAMCFFLPSPRVETRGYMLGPPVRGRGRQGCSRLRFL